MYQLVRTSKGRLESECITKRWSDDLIVPVKRQVSWQAEIGCSFQSMSISLLFLPSICFADRPGLDSSSLTGNLGSSGQVDASRLCLWRDYVKVCFHLLEPFKKLYHPNSVALFTLEYFYFQLLTIY